MARGDSIQLGSQPVRAMADVGLARLAGGLLAAVLIVLVGFAAYYAYDRYWVSVESPLDQATRQLEEAVKQSPNDPEARMRVAGAYVRQKEYGRAIAQYEEALKLRKDWQPALIAMAFAELARGQEGRAAELYQKVADLNAGNEFRHANRDLQIVYYRLGTFAAKAGRHSDAAGWARESLAIDRTNADALFLLATSEEVEGNQSAAADAYRLATAFDPNFREAFAGLHRIAVARGDSREAAFAHGMETLAGGDANTALTEFRRLASDSPDYGPAYLGLGLAYGKKGQREEAIGAFRAALDRDSSLLLAQWSLGSMR
ncbi:MAG: tetratricopeptide repeat protein [Chloroflexota bacterium]